MIQLILTVLCSSGNALMMKYVEKRSENRTMLLLINYIVAVLFGLGVVVQKHTGAALADSTSPEILKVAAMGLVNGLMYISSFKLLQYNIEKNGATISSSVNRMGLVIPTVLSIILFKEFPNLLQVLGIATAITAILIISVPGKSAQRMEGNSNNRWLLVPMLLATGIGDITSKIFTVYGKGDLEPFFMVVTYGMALSVCIFFAARAGEKMNKVDLICGTILGISNYLSVKFMIGALYQLPAFFVYVSFGIAVILVVNIVNLLIMHEKLAKKEIISMLIIMLAIILLNM